MNSVDKRRKCKATRLLALGIERLCDVKGTIRAKERVLGRSIGADIQILGQQGVFWLSVLFVVLECLSAQAQDGAAVFSAGNGARAGGGYSTVC